MSRYNVLSATLTLVGAFLGADEDAVIEPVLATLERAVGRCVILANAPPATVSAPDSTQLTTTSTPLRGLELWRPFVADVVLPVGVRTRIRTCASIKARRVEFAEFLAYRNMQYNGVAVGCFLRQLEDAGAKLATKECYRLRLHCVLTLGALHGVHHDTIHSH